MTILILTDRSPMQTGHPASMSGSAACRAQLTQKWACPLHGTEVNPSCGATMRSMLKSVVGTFEVDGIEVV